MRIRKKIRIDRCSIIGLLSAVALVVFPFRLQAAEEDSEKINFGFGTDIVSSYVWRGLYQAGASIQPGISFGIGGFGLSLWGSTDFKSDTFGEGNSAKEIDMEASYEIGETGLGFIVSDYWYTQQWEGGFFNYKSKETSHAIEAGVYYRLPFEKFPLSLSWHTFFYGDDKDEAGESQNYSSYYELSCPFKVKMVDLETAIGMVPYESPYYETDGFAVTNIALKASASIPLSSKFALPVFTQAVWNPCNDDAHILFGISLNFGDY